MNTSVRVAALALGSVAALVAPHPAQAQYVVTCDNCSTAHEQVLQYGKEAQQFETQLQQYGTELRQYANMLQNTAALPMNLWSQARSDIAQVQSIMNAVGMLGGNSGSFMQQLGQIGSLTTRITSLGQMQAQYQTWASVTQQDVASLQAALGLQESQRASDALLLQNIDAQSQSAVGQMQAIQAGNEFASLGVKQMQSLEQLLEAQARVVQDQATVAADRRAAADAAMAKFLSNPDAPVHGEGW